jgi:NADH-quinone oxidoreductase subunit N
MNYTQLFFATLPETVLEIAALLVLVVDLGFLRKAELKTRAITASLLGVVGCVVALWTQHWSLSQGVWGFGVGDSHGLLLANINSAAAAQAGVLVLTALTLLLLIDSRFTRHVGEFVAVVLMSAAGGLLIAAAQDLLIIFLGLELLSLGLYILTAFAKQSGRSAESAIKYYLFGGMSAAFLLFGFSYLYGIAGSTNLDDVMTAIHRANGPSIDPLLIVSMVMVAAGLGFKVAAVPFHLWAPDTYEGAPAPGAAFIASVSKVASFALLISIGIAGAHVFDAGNANSSVTAGAGYAGFRGLWTIVLTILSLASMLFGNLAALAQISVRRLLAYSAVAHAGYILLALAYFRIDAGAPYQSAGYYRGATAVLYYILSYGLTTIGAFGVIGVVERVTGSDRMDAFLGLHKRNPLLAAVLLVLFLSLAGIPPLVGFWAKFNLFAVVLGVGAGRIPFALVALAVAMSAVSLYYYLQVLKRVFVMPAVDEPADSTKKISIHPVTMLVLLAIAAAVVGMGCFPALLQGWIEGFYRKL